MDRPFTAFPRRAPGRRAGRPCRWLTKVVTVAVSSSVKLAGAEPFPVTPAFLADVNQHLAVELQLFR